MSSLTIRRTTGGTGDEGSLVCAGPAQQAILGSGELVSKPLRALEFHLHPDQLPGLAVTPDCDAVGPLREVHGESCQSQGSPHYLLPGLFLEEPSRAGYAKHEV